MVGDNTDWPAPCGSSSTICKWTGDNPCGGAYKHPRKLANTIIIVHKISWPGMVVVGWLRVKWARIPKLDEVSCSDGSQKDNKCVT